MQSGNDSSPTLVFRSVAEHGFALRKAIAMSRFLMATGRSTIDPKYGQDIIV